MYHSLIRRNKAKRPDGKSILKPHTLNRKTLSACLSIEMTCRLARKVKAMRVAVGANLLSAEQPLAMFFDLDDFRLQIAGLKGAFPSNFTHCMAVKAQPTLKIMEMARCEGVGFECASIGELTQSLKTGIDPKLVVFDSPIKTNKELALTLRRGIPFNIDNWQELERVVALREVPENSTENEVIGLRINPQSGMGANAQLSTGVATSKFGIGLVDNRAQILAAYERHTWLNMVHIHSGSQGVSFELAAKGLRNIVDLALEVNATLGRQQITTIDVGGGLSVNFASEEVTPTFDEYATLLRECVPELFDPAAGFTVLTEMGRSLNSKSGWFGSRVEYNKLSGGRHIAVQHAGADLCIRTIYHPETWPLRIDVFDGAGAPRWPVAQGSELEGCTAATAGTTAAERAAKGELYEHDIAGPCCIAGDIIAHQRPMPVVQQGDHLMIHDVGGYYHASHSKYNLRQSPPVYGYSQAEDGKLVFELLQSGETVDETCAFFGVRPQGIATAPPAAPI